MDVQIRKRSDGVLHLDLDRPKALNALSPFMIATLEETLLETEEDDEVSLIAFGSTSERAFCAGGDIKEIYHAGIENADVTLLFAEKEYELARKVYHHPKTTVTLADGIVMGGGNALALPSNHLVGTERTLFAMPEVKIGYFPDVGATYFLSRLPKRMGWYLALTGQHIGAADCKQCGLIKQFIPSPERRKFLEGLPEITTKEIDLGPPTVDANHIEECFSKGSLEEIISSFGEEHFTSLSPLSLRIAYEQLKRAEKMGFDQVIDQDISIAKELLNQADVYEGVRAQLINRDHDPKWPSHPDINEIVERAFSIS